MIKNRNIFKISVLKFNFFVYIGKQKNYYPTNICKMAEKVKFELEYLLKTSPKVLGAMITTPSGLSDWFADDVDIKDDIYTFHWDGSSEQARLLSKKANLSIKFQWLEDEEEELDTFLEIQFKVDPMTKMVVLNITSFSDDDELEETELYWNKTVDKLKHKIGA